MRLTYIYILIDPRTGMARYVGKTWNIKNRMNSHRGDKGRSRKRNWIHSLMSVGLKPIVEIIEEVFGGNDVWQEAERFWIASFKSIGAELLNHDNGGNQGKEVSEETKQKIRISNTGKRHAAETIRQMSAAKKSAVTQELRDRAASIWKGKKMPRELVDKRAATATGQKRTDEFKEAQRIRSTGKLHTQESIERIRIAKLGLKASDETRRKQSEAHLGIKKGSYKKWSDEDRAAQKARLNSPEVKEKQRSAAKAREARKRAALTAKPIPTVTFIDEVDTAALMACEI